MRIIERLGFTVYCPTTVENFMAGSTEINGSVLFDKRNEFGKRREDPIVSDGAISRRSLDDKFKKPEYRYPLLHWTTDLKVAQIYALQQAKDFNCAAAVMVGRVSIRGQLLDRLIGRWGIIPRGELFPVSEILVGPQVNWETYLNPAQFTSQNPRELLRQE